MIIQHECRTCSNYLRTGGKCNRITHAIETTSDFEQPLSRLDSGELNEAFEETAIFEKIVNLILQDVKITKVKKDLILNDESLKTEIGYIFLEEMNRPIKNLIEMANNEIKIKDNEFSCIFWE
jgi:hypothetical protein